MSTLSPWPLTPRQRRLVHDSFESIQEYQDTVVVLFYGRLFEVAPDIRPLFKISVREQSRKLMDMLATVVLALDSWEQLQPKLVELGRRHIEYGALSEHYEALRSSLLWAFGQALGVEFDRETRAAWTGLITAISAAMQKG